jgi:hypothetical protein
MTRRRLGLEPLEERRTPAVLVDGKTVTFTDADGDAATVAFSQSVLTTANVGSAFQFDTPFDTATGRCQCLATWAASPRATSIVAGPA